MEKFLLITIGFFLLQPGCSGDALNGGENEDTTARQSSDGDVDGNSNEEDTDDSGCMGEMTATKFLYVNLESSGGDGTTWETAYSTVQEGLAAARELSDDCQPVEVRVAEGTYNVYVSSESDTLELHANVTLRGGWAGDESETETNDPQKYETVLSGFKSGNDTVSDRERVTSVVTGAHNSALMGVTITGGNASEIIDFYFAGPGHSGGALYIEGGSMTVSDCVFEDNKARFGGAIASYNAQLIIEKCTFIGNEAENGGAIHLGSGHNSRIQDSSFRGNLALENGGALDARDHSLSLLNVEFRDNVCGYYSDLGGGTIGGCGVNFENIHAEIDASTFIANKSVGNITSLGGAIYTGNSGDVIIRNSLFKENSADSGGAIAANNYLELLSSILVGNHAGNSGGAVMSHKDLRVGSVLLARNDATKGGALYLTDDVSVEIWNATIAGNRASVSGGAIQVVFDTTVYIGNSILWANPSGNEGDQIYVEMENSRLCTVEYSNTEDSISGVGNISEDPLFVSFGDDPENDNFSLLSASPCVDAATDGDGETFTTPMDANRNTRYVGAALDMGAFELQ